MRTSPEYRFAEPAEIAEIANMVRHSFPGPPRTPQWWQEQLTDPVYGGGAETLVVGVEDGRIIAALQIHRLEQWIAGAPVPMTGVGTVTVAPTHRKRRIARALMEAGLRLGAERGDHVSALYPFRVSFYQALGYGAAGTTHQYLVPPSTLPDSDERRRVEMAETAESRAELLAFYMAWIRGQTGQITRTTRAFARMCMMPDRGVFAYRGGAGSIEGYAIVNYRVDLPRRERYLEVDELVWTTPNARAGLLAWLGSLGDQWDLVLLRAQPAEHLENFISEPRLPHGAAPLWMLWSPAATLMMGPMSRLVDVQRAFSTRTSAETNAIRVALTLKDELLPANNGAFILDLAEGHAVMQRGNARADVNIDTDISTLSRLYIGALRATDAAAAGLLRCDRPEQLQRLDAALALPEPWTFDRF